MRVLIAGGGIAGTVAALAAQRAGLEPEIYEAYPTSAGIGQGSFLTVAINGLDALRAVDADGVVTSAGVPSRAMHFYSGTGKPIGTMSLGPSTPGHPVAHSIRRADLYRGLDALVRARGIPVWHERRLTGAARLPGGGVRASFADGTHADGDVLVGADGVHSATRKLISASNPEPRYLGMGNAGGFTRPPAGLEAGEPGEYRMIWGRECFFGYLVDPAGEIWWFANPLRREPWPRGTEGNRELLAGLLDRDDTPAAAIVRATPGDIAITNQWSLAHVPAWHDDTTVLIGDAAHAVSPTSGQGASLAAEDGVLLARCLRDGSSVPSALRDFALSRRPRVERVARESARMNSTKKAGPLTRAVRDALLPPLLRWMNTPGQQAKQDWLHRHHVTLGNR